MGRKRQPDQMAVMSLGEHLEELRMRLILCIGSVLVSAVVCWIFRYRLMDVLEAPHVRAMEAFGYDVALKYAGYWDPVWAQLKLCLIVAIVITSPFLIYQIWAFVAPGLFPHERFRVVRLGAASLVCFIGGVAFGYFLFIPVALRYMVILAGPGTEPVLMIDRYVSLFFMLTLALGLAFQTPVVVAYLIRWNAIRPESLQRHRKVAILVAFVVAAVITPPDPLTQMMMGLTLVVLYDLGGLVAAPSRATVLSFVRFAGVIVLAVAAFVAWARYWPVAELTALRGTVQVAGRPVEERRPVDVRRGMRILAGEGAIARVSLGGDEGGAILHFLGPGSLQALAPGKVAQDSGSALVTSADDVPVAVHAGPAAVTLRGGRVEVRVVNEDTVTVTTFEGTATVAIEGSEQLVKAGRTKTFYRGGLPADTAPAEQRWQQLLGPPPAPEG